jgi:hypothetical protein
LFHPYYVTTMSPPTKIEASHDQRETEPRQRRSSRLNRKHQGGYSKSLTLPMTLRCSRLFSHHCQLKSLNWRLFTLLSGEILLSLRAATIVTTLRVSRHLQCHFGDLQTCPQGLKLYLLQYT